jgi:hypothetical protein
MERFQHHLEEAVRESKDHKEHGPQCHCLTCKWDDYKKTHDTHHWSWLGQDHTSLLLGAVAGSFLTLIGVMLFKNWRQNAFASLSSHTPTTKVVSSDPTVLVNNATESVHNIITADPALGILYSPSTALYEIRADINLVLDETVTSSQIVRVMVVKNGLPNDSAATLLQVEQGLTPGLPQVVSLSGKRILKGEDYIQVFWQVEDGTVPVVRIGEEFSISLVKVQRAE